MRVCILADDGDGSVIMPGMLYGLVGVVEDSGWFLYRHSKTLRIAENAAENCK